MPNNPLQPGTLAYTCYPASPQTFYNDMFELGVAIQSTTLTGVIMQDAVPDITDRDKAWIRTSGGAPVTPPVWVFYNGDWVAKHPVPAGTEWALPYTGAIANIATLDGGAAGVVSDNTGPFWELVTALAARFPIGAGTLPSGLVLATGDTGGEEVHELVQQELPAFTVTTKMYGANADGDNRNVFGGDLLGNSQASSITPTNFVSDTVGGDSAGVTVPHGTMPPYVALSFLRRTARVYLTSPIA